MGPLAQPAHGSQTRYCPSQLHSRHQKSAAHGLSFTAPSRPGPVQCLGKHADWRTIHPTPPPHVLSTAQPRDEYTTAQRSTVVPLQLATCSLPNIPHKTRHQQQDSTRSGQGSRPGSKQATTSDHGLNGCLSGPARSHNVGRLSPTHMPWGVDSGCGASGPSCSVQL